MFDKHSLLSLSSFSAKVIETFVCVQQGERRSMHLEFRREFTGVHFPHLLTLQVAGVKPRS